MRTTTSYALAGTRSFRAATRKAMGHWGTNLQNSDPNLAECLIADPGKKIIHADQAGAEALIVAHEAPRGRFRRLFEVGIKPHTYMALQIFLDKFCKDKAQAERFNFADPDVIAADPDWPEIDKAIRGSKREYALGKKTIHARNYDMHWPTFQLSVLKDTEGALLLSNKEAKRYLQTHTDLFPEITVWQDTLAGKAEKDRVVYNLFGFPRVISEPWGSKTRREVLSFPAQSTVGVITHRAFTMLTKMIHEQRRPWDLLFNKHDSIDMQVPEEDEEEAARTLLAALSQTLTASDGHQFQMRAEVQTGWNMGRYDKETNPKGLKDYDL